jgi:hypothetical protein
MNQMRRLLIVGPSRAGKDTACAYLARVTELRFAGSTSLYLARYVAAHLGVSEEEAYRTRHLNRNLWHRIGNRVRKQDPGLLIRASLAHAEIAGGIRHLAELEVCRKEQLVDLIVWIANERARRDSTLEFDERACDIVVPNHWTVEEFHCRLLRLARFAGLPLRPEATPTPVTWRQQGSAEIHFPGAVDQ